VFLDLVRVVDRPRVQPAERLARGFAERGEAEGLLQEHGAWAGRIVRPAAERLIRGGLAHGARTPDGERDLEGLLRELV
jgi:hypothetical protein